jgi:hypothetical protein
LRVRCDLSRRARLPPMRRQRSHRTRNSRATAKPLDQRYAEIGIRGFS